jgi:autotransporter-associated beta strand protein
LEPKAESRKKIEKIKNFLAGSWGKRHCAKVEGKYPFAHPLTPDSSEKMNPRNPSKNARRALPSQGLAIGKIVIPALSLALAAAPVAHAANEAWSTNPNDGTFGGVNWTVGTTGQATPTNAAASGDALFFDTSTITTLNNDLSSATFAGFTFNSGASAYTIGGNAFTLSGALTNNSSSLQSFSNAITFAAAQTITGAGNIALSGNLGGGGTSLTKSGTGTLSLSGATNSIGGNMLLSAGRLNVTAGTTNFAGAFSKLADTASTAAIASVSSGATLGWTGANGGQFGGASGASAALYNSGTFNQSATTVNNAGIYLGNAANSYGYLRNSSGATTTVAGRLWIAQGGNAAGANGVLDITGGTVSVNPTGTFTAGQRLLINGDNNTHATSTSYAGVNIANGTLTVGGNAAQTNINTGQNEYTSINITGTGKWTAGNSGTDSGIGLGVTNIASNTATLSISNGGTLETSYIYNNNASGKGIINIDNGTIRSLFNNSTGIIQGTNTKTYIYSGGATFDTNGFATTVQNPLLAPTGNGVTNITLGGTTTGYVGAPVVVISGGGGTGAAAVANFDPTTGTVTGITITAAGSGYTTDPTITLVGGNGGAGTGTATATATTGAVTGGGLTKTGSGTLTLSAVNTYTGATTVSQGTVKLGAAGSILNSASIAITAGATFDTTAQSFTMLGSQPFTFTLDPTAAGSAGLLAAGALDITNGSVSFSTTGTLDDSSYVIGTYSGLTGTSFATVNNLPSGYAIDYNFGGTNNTIALVAVPEPHEFALAITALLGALIFARRRQARRCE